MTNKEKVNQYYMLIRLGKLLCVLMLTVLLYASVSVSKAEAAEHKILLTGPVNEQQYVRELPKILKIKEGDTVYIRVHGPGGSMMYGLELMRLLTKVDTTKVCSVKSYAASMSAFYLTMCDKIYTNKQAKVMFHLPYVPGEGGQKTRSPEVLEFGNWITEKLGVDKILPPEAKKAYDAGKDVWMSGETLVKLMEKAPREKLNLSFMLPLEEDTNE